MFTGIIQNIGIVRRIKRQVLEVSTGLQCKIGDSVAVNGACLTVTAPLSRGRLAFDLSAETLSLTNLGALKAGMAVNLEAALRAGEPLGGHLVSGHVDGRAKLLASRTLPGSFRRLRVAQPQALRGLVALKGSVAVDGVSLTITGVGPGWFETVLVPHTLDHTNLARRKVGELLNLEADLIARYVRSSLKYAP